MSRPTFATFQTWNTETEQEDGKIAVNLKEVAAYGEYGADGLTTTILLKSGKALQVRARFAEVAAFFSSGGDHGD